MKRILIILGLLMLALPARAVEYGNVTAKNLILGTRGSDTVTTIGQAGMDSIVTSATRAGTRIGATGTGTFTTMSLTGALNLATDSPANGANYQIRISRSVTGTGINQDNVRDLSTINSDAAGAMFCSFDSSLIVQGATAYDHMAGFQDRINYYGSGSLTNLWGFMSVPYHTGAGTITNRTGLYVQDVTGTGTLTNNYGVYVSSLTRGGTLNYAIFTAGTTPSDFGGNVEIGALNYINIGNAPQSWVNLGTNDDGATILGLNLAFKDTTANKNTLVTPKAHAAMSGAGIVIGGNQANINTLAVGDIGFFTSPTGSVTAAATYSAAPDLKITAATGAVAAAGAFSAASVSATTATLSSVLILTPLADDPTSPTAGMIWTRTNGHAYVHLLGTTKQLDN